MGKGIQLLLALLTGWLSSLSEPDPPIEDAARFPPASVVEPLLELSIAHLEYRRHLPRDSYHDLRNWYWLCEAHRCREAWGILEEIQATEIGSRWEGSGELTRPRNSERVRRQKLGELRDLIGRKDYHAGRMPPPVPLWRYVCLD